MLSDGRRHGIETSEDSCKVVILTLRVRSNLTKTLCRASSASFKEAFAIDEMAQHDASFAKAFATMATCFAGASAHRSHTGLYRVSPTV